jgi:hypothetical protein
MTSGEERPTADDASSPGEREVKTEGLTVTEKEGLEELIPIVADLRARGYPDWRIREEQRKFYPGQSWSKTIDVALRTVTEKQVMKAKEDGIQSAMTYVIYRKADGLEDWRIESEGSRDGVSFVKDALRRVTPEQIAEEVRRRPKPRQPIPEEVKEEQLVEQLRWKPEYVLLQADERELAESIIRMRWEGRSYVSIRYLLGDTEDYQYLRTFDRAWVTTNFVKSEMLLDGRQPPRQTARGRKRSKKNRENSPEWKFHQEYTRKERDLATMRLWRDEGNCIACGKPADREHTYNGLDGSHHHVWSACPVCGKKPHWLFSVQIEYHSTIWQTYCQPHRPHITDRRRAALLAQAAYFRKLKEESRKRRSVEKEKRELERRTPARTEPKAIAPEVEEEPESEGSYLDPAEEQERRLEDGEQE